MFQGAQRLGSRVEGMLWDLLRAFIWDPEQWVSGVVKGCL